MEHVAIDALRGAPPARKPGGHRGVRVRHVRPDDAAAVQRFVRELSDATRRLRFFAPIRELSPGMLQRLTQSGDGPDQVLVCLADSGGEARIVAVAQYAVAEDGETCELALVIADDWQGHGLGRSLMARLIESARDAGMTRVVGDVLRGNAAMLALARAFGFAVTHSHHDATMFRVRLDLDEAAAAARAPLRPARSGPAAHVH